MKKYLLLSFLLLLGCDKRIKTVKTIEDIKVYHGNNISHEYLITSEDGYYIKVKEEAELPKVGDRLSGFWYNN